MGYNRHARNRGWWGYMKYIVRMYGSVKDPETDMERRELEAVHRAVDETLRRYSGKTRIELVELVYWRQSHTLTGAALKLHLSERTAKRWNGEFIKCVAAEFFGDKTLMDDYRAKKNAKQEEQKNESTSQT